MRLMGKLSNHSEKLPDQLEEPSETVTLVILGHGPGGQLHGDRQQKHRPASPGHTTGGNASTLPSLQGLAGGRGMPVDMKGREI